MCTTRAQLRQRKQTVMWCSAVSWNEWADRCQELAQDRKIVEEMRCVLEETSAGNNREKQLCAISHGIGVLAEIQELEKVSLDAAGRAACPKRTVVIPTAASPCQLQLWVKDSFDDIFLNHCEGQPVYVDESHRQGDSVGL